MACLGPPEAMTLALTCGVPGNTIPPLRTGGDRPKGGPPSERANVPHTLALFVYSPSQFSSARAAGSCDQMLHVFAGSRSEAP